MRVHLGSCKMVKTACKFPPPMHMATLKAKFQLYGTCLNLCLTGSDMVREPTNLAKRHCNVGASPFRCMECADSAATPAFAIVGIPFVLALIPQYPLLTCGPFSWRCQPFAATSKKPPAVFMAGGPPCSHLKASGYLHWQHASALSAWSLAHCAQHCVTLTPMKFTK
mmetsp:Transcript_50344/g.89951  ORF Transcript_50344/g.89951 Transcript_50344/m.89951 type:complete len:167 (+) Transcript_50344:608-1108(+)